MSSYSLDSILEKLREAEKSSTVDHAELSWWKSFSEQDFEEASALIETELNDKPNAPIARLWWVRVELEKGNLPATALSAPLEEILDELKRTPSSYLSSCVTFCEVANRLFEGGNGRLGIIMLERSLGFAQTSEELKHSLRDELETSLRRTLEGEQKEAEQRREKRAYLAFIEEKLSHYKKDTDIPETEEAPRLSNPKVGARYSFRVLALSLLTLIGGGTLLAWQLNKGVEDLPSLFAKKQEQVPSQEAPAQAPTESTKLTEGEQTENSKSDSDQLDLLNERLKNLNFAKKEEGETKNKEQQEKDSSIVLPSTKKDDVPVPTYDPNSVDFDKETHQAFEPSEREQIPDLDPKKSEETEVVSIGGSKQQSKVVGLDEPNNGKTVEPADGAVLYRTITATEVVAAPSFLAKSLAHLEANAPIHVVGKNGQWLELRSTGGRRGFIFAQDAIVANNTKKE